MFSLDRSIHISDISMMPIYNSGIYTREIFGDLLNENGLTGEGVEVGTHRAVFARAILNRWKGKVLHCVDPWSVPSGYEDQSSGLSASSGDREADLYTAKKMLSVYGDRARMHKMTSLEAIETNPPLFAFDSLDFVYIDGDHRAEHIRFDLFTWYERIKPGGIIAGHDWLCPNEVNHGWGKGIQPEVFRFAVMRMIPTIYVIPEPNGMPWSFYCFKPKLSEENK